MTTEKFIRNNTALITLIAACLVVLISLSVRQVFGMFFMDFNTDLGITNTEFGLAIGIQMLGWGLSGPIFGAIADKYGGHKAISLAFLFYILGIYFLSRPSIELATLDANIPAALIKLLQIIFV